MRFPSHVHGHHAGQGQWDSVRNVLGAGLGGVDLRAVLGGSLLRFVASFVVPIRHILGNDRGNGGHHGISRGRRDFFLDVRPVLLRAGSSAVVDAAPGSVDVVLFWSCHTMLTSSSSGTSSKAITSS